MNSRCSLLLVVVILLFASCGGASSREPASISALEERFADFAQQSEAQWNARQEHIQICMGSEGFDYLARPFIAEPEPKSSAFAIPIASGEGYGLAAWIGAQREQTDAASNENPNRELLEQLPASERLSWAEAYGGSDTRLDWPSLIVLDQQTGNPLMTNEAPSRGGCLGTAIQEVGSSSYLEPFAEELTLIGQRFESDPELVSAEQAWSLCMAAAGHQHQSPRTLFAQIQLDALELAFSEEPIDDFAERERALAFADESCRSQTAYGEVAVALDEKLASEILGLLDSGSDA